MLFIAIDSYSQDVQKYFIYVPPFCFTLKKGICGYFVAQNDEFVSNALEHLATPEQPLESITLSTMEEQIPLVPQLTTTTHHHNVYYHCERRDFQTALVKCTSIKDHVVLCTFGLQDSERLSLHSFVFPLRACSLREQELKPIVIIGNKNCIQQNWCEIAEFDQVFVIDGDPLDKGTLVAANVAQCSSCVILGSTASLDEDAGLVDKQPILCSLILKSFSFGGEVAGNEIKSGNGINRITELYKEENVRFLDLNDKDNGKYYGISHTFAQGASISNSIFDALMAVAYFNPGVTAFFEMLVTGENDSIMYGNRELSCSPRFLQISLQEEKYKKFEGLNFSELFACLLGEKMLCIGISRVMENQTNSNQLKRYAITSPHNLPLKPDDNIFVLISN